MFTLIAAYMLKWATTADICARYGFPAMKCDYLGKGSFEAPSDHRLSEEADSQMLRLRQSIRVVDPVKLAFLFCVTLAAAVTIAVTLVAADALSPEQGMPSSVVIFLAGLELGTIVYIFLVRSSYNARRVEVAGEIHKIIRNDREDFLLASNIQGLLIQERELLGTDDLAPDEKDRIDPTNSEEDGWLVRDVQYHRGGDNSIAGRDVTITVSSRNDTKVLVVPSSSTVRSWLRSALGELERKAIFGTHLHAQLWDMSPESLLEPVRESKGGLLDQIGKLHMASVGSEQDPPFVQIYGQPTADGSILLEAMTSKDISIIVAPVATIQRFATKVSMLLEAHAGNPALLEPAHAVSAAA